LGLLAGTPAGRLAAGSVVPAGILVGHPAAGSAVTRWGRALIQVGTPVACPGIGLAGLAGVLEDEKKARESGTHLLIGAVQQGGALGRLSAMLARGGRGAGHAEPALLALPHVSPENAAMIAAHTTEPPTVRHLLNEGAGCLRLTLLEPACAQTLADAALRAEAAATQADLIATLLTALRRRYRLTLRLLPPFAQVGHA
jgi:hypothetical protein